MREIKFRAMNFGGVWWYTPKEFTYSAFFNAMYPKDGSTPILNRITLGQFTGLLDKNGKEIYENDILRFKARGEELVGHVVYEPPMFLAIIGSAVTYSVRFDMDNNFEVIGNIWEGTDEH